MQLDAHRIVRVESRGNFPQFLLYPMRLALKYSEASKYKVPLLCIGYGARLVEVEQIHRGH